MGLLLATLSAFSAPVRVGDPVPSITAQDQRGLDFHVTTNLQFLLVVNEMTVAKAANVKLAALGAGYLETNHAAYLMDIHAMPGIARLFAFPKLRKYPQRIVLVERAEMLAAIPFQPGCVTVLRLNAAERVETISFWNPATAPMHPLFAP